MRSNDLGSPRQQVEPAVSRQVLDDRKRRRGRRRSVPLDGEGDQEVVVDALDLGVSRCPAHSNARGKGPVPFLQLDRFRVSRVERPNLEGTFSDPGMITSDAMTDDTARMLLSALRTPN